MAPSSDSPRARPGRLPFRLIRLIRRGGPRAIALGFALGITLEGCDQPTLAWVDADSQRQPLSSFDGRPVVPMDSTLVDGTAPADRLLAQDQQREAAAWQRLALLARPTTVVPAAPLGGGTRPLDPARCARSLRMVDAGALGTVAVWWTRATGGRVHLVGAWRDGRAPAAAWRGPLPIDTLDQGPGDAQAVERGAHGCVRAAPSLAWDVRTGFVHVAYALRGPEGAGVFYAHQMHPLAPFELPVAVLYGEQLGVVRVGSDGDVVAVTYEDPNGRGRSRVGVAVSRTAGHTFDASRLVASRDAAQARDPHVAVVGRIVAVGWTEGAMGGAPAADAAPAFVTRRLRVRR